MKNRMDESDPLQLTSDNRSRIGKEAKKRRLAKLNFKIADRKKRAEKLQNGERPQLFSSSSKS